MQVNKSHIKQGKLFPVRLHLAENSIHVCIGASSSSVACSNCFGAINMIISWCYILECLEEIKHDVILCNLLNTFKAAHIGIRYMFDSFTYLYSQLKIYTKFGV